MADETNTTAAPLTPAQEREQAIKAYYDATTREAKAALVAKFPVLKTVFSDANHS